MAIDPRIALGIQAPDLGQAFMQGQQIAANAEALKSRKRQNKLMEIAGQAKYGQAGGNEAFNQLAQFGPEGVKMQKNLRDTQQGITKDFLTNAALATSRGSRALAENDTETALRAANDMLTMAKTAGMDTSDIEQNILDIQAGNLDAVKADWDGDLLAAQEQGVWKPVTPISSVGKEEFDVKRGFVTPEQIDSHRAGRGTNVSIINEAEGKGLTEEQKALAKSRVSRFEEIQNTASAAHDQNEVIAQLENMDITSGLGEGLKVQGARVLKALGVEDRELEGYISSAQAFNAKSGQLLAEALAAQKGPQTDRDADRIKDTLPQIGNEDAANRFIMSSLRAINERKIEQAEFYERVLEDKGSLKEADKLWRDFKRKTPMLSDNVVDRETGLPMFFNDFRDKAVERNPDATMDEIIDAWRKLAND